MHVLEHVQAPPGLVSSKVPWSVPCEPLSAHHPRGKHVLVTLGPGDQLLFLCFSAFCLFIQVMLT